MGTELFAFDVDNGQTSRLSGKGTGLTGKMGFHPAFRKEDGVLIAAGSSWYQNTDLAAAST